MLDTAGDRLDETGGFPDEFLRQILGVTQVRDRLRNNVRLYRCKKQPTVEKRIQWNRLRRFGHVCHLDDSRLPKRLLLAECLDGWRCPPNTAKKQWKDQVAADMMAVRGDWRGLRHDVTAIKRRCDNFSERAHPDATSVDGDKCRSDPIGFLGRFTQQTPVNPG